MSLVESVEGVEELLLGTLFAADELDIVDEKYVRVAVLLAELRHLRKTEGFDKLVCEVVALDVADHLVGVVLLYLVADSVEQVGFAETRVTVQKERIVRL